MAESVTAAEHASGLEAYAQAGLAIADEIANRGPIRFDSAGWLHPDILEAYWEHGYYVFEGLIEQDEIELLRADIGYLLEHAPTGKNSTVDTQGRPAVGTEFTRPLFNFIKPLSDPWGGTDLLNGRHPARMVEPQPADDAPREVVYLVTGMCQAMPAGLRLYGHPGVLSIAAGINGDDFVPYNDAIFVKEPGLGGAVAWHQDGVTHWDSPQWDKGIHGFNFQVQLYRCTPFNGLWVMPGTHKLGRIDIKARIAENGGSEQLPGAVPLVCEPGDVTIVNRQMLHCSFPNTSPDPRISLTFGFHRRSSVLGARGALSQTADEVYDEERIFERSRVIQVAIDARAQKYPEETSFTYEPFRGMEDNYRYSDRTYRDVIVDYNLKDLSI